MKKANEEGKYSLVRYGKYQRNSAIADHKCCCPVVYTV